MKKMMDWKIWLTKWAYGVAASAGSAALFYTANYFETSTLPPEYAFWGGIGATVCLQLGNYIKHKYLDK
jgi:hypothetical protein